MERLREQSVADDKTGNVASQRALSQDEHSLNKAADAVMQMEIVVSTVLRYGVAASFIIVTIGIVTLLMHLYTVPGHYSVASIMPSASSGTLVLHSPLGVFRGLLQHDPNAVIALGLLVLIATPILRVAISAIVFFLERDRLYVLITLFVLAVLILSFLIGTAG